MSLAIEVKYESERGCGFRKEGGLYLVSDGPAVECCKLPIELNICRTCGQGIKPARGWTWIEPLHFFGNVDCSPPRSPRCALPSISKRSGLLWVGKTYYFDEDDFIKESKEQGISRRIGFIPRDFVIGETWVFLAHRLARIASCLYKPGIFSFFLPQRIEYVVAEDDTTDKLERLVKKGVHLVQVKPLQTEIEFSNERKVV